jgi:monoamine oxidase
MSKSKKIIVGFLILLSLSFSFTATVTDPNLYDVIVVGGGVSGLSAMSALAKGAKINTLLLEGGNRLGGRAYTIPFGTNEHIELGAQVT